MDWVREEATVAASPAASRGGLVRLIKTREERVGGLLGPGMGTTGGVSGMPHGEPAEWHHLRPDNQIREVGKLETGYGWCFMYRTSTTASQTKPATMLACLQSTFNKLCHLYRHGGYQTDIKYVTDIDMIKNTCKEISNFKRYIKTRTAYTSGK